MWNKRKEQAIPKLSSPSGGGTSLFSVPAAVAPRPVEVKKEATPVSSNPMARFDPESRGGLATVGKAVRIVGQVYSKEELYIDGDLKELWKRWNIKSSSGPMAPCTPPSQRAKWWFWERSREM